MKKNYETPVVEKIEFDYVESVTAHSSSDWGGGCGTGGNGSTSGFDPNAYSTLNGQTVYMNGHPGDPCQSSLAPDAGCGFDQAKARGNFHTDNVGYYCNT